MKIRFSLHESRRKFTGRNSIYSLSPAKVLGSALVLLFFFTIGLTVHDAEAQSRTYSVDADFAEGTLVNLNFDPPNNNQLQLNQGTAAFPFVNIAASARGTAVRSNTETGEITGEYFTAPNGRGRNPSRTTVDQLGNVWVGNRAENSAVDGIAKGSATRIGLVIGGTRVDADGTPNPNGQYLMGPFEYNTCEDRDGDGLIKTSRGLGDILPWTNAGNADSFGGVSTAEDECIINYVRAGSGTTRTITIDANNDVWIGGTGSGRRHEKVSGITGEPVEGTEFSFPCGGYGGFIDGNGILWSMTSGSQYLRYDTNTATGQCISLTNYGTGIDPITGEIWITQLSGNAVHKVAADGTLLGTFTHGNSNAQGVAVDNNGSVWVAHSLFNQTTVGHLKTDGTYIGNVTLPGGNGPTGIAIDAAGKIWVANINTSNAMRIDPTAGPIGADGITPIGAVDLTVSLNAPGLANAGPYNYSDMTGAVVAGVTAPQGSWTVVFDGGQSGVIWDQISWNADVPMGSSVTVQVRAAEVQGDLGDLEYISVENGVSFAGTGIEGRFIQMRTTLARDPGSQDSPILFDLTVNGLGEQVCAPPMVTESADRQNRTITVEVTDPEGILSAGFVDPDGNTVLVNLIATLVSGDMETSDNVNWTAIDPDNPPTSAIFELAVDEGATTSQHFITVENGCGASISVDPIHAMPSDATFAVRGSYPNPFMAEATIGFSLGKADMVRIDVFNALGQHIRSLVAETMDAGSHEIRWDGTDASGRGVSPGIYFARISTSHGTGTARLVKR